MAHDPETFRRESLVRWESAAAGWGAQRPVVQAAAEPVSAWMVEAIAPQPGHQILELAAGPGDTGFLAAEQILPGGRLLSTDSAAGMVEQARARSQELAVTNVKFRTLDAEWLDLPAAALDGVLCRWGYMLMADPAAALRETRRVLRPGGRVALATWAEPDENPWASVPGRVLVEMDAMGPPEPDEPHMFALADPQRIQELLDEAGFTEVQLDQLDLEFAYSDLDEYWDVQLDLSTGLRAAVTAMTPAQRDDARDAIDARLAEYVAADGSVRLPGRTNVATASA